MAILSETIPLGEWLPDRADLENQGCLVAKNVTTDGEDYRPFPQFVPSSTSATDKVYGGYTHVSSSGTITTFLATRTKIYTVNGSSLTDVTNTGGDYVTPVDGCWFFEQFGDRVIATNYVDKIQTFLVGTDTEFSDLITTGPDVKCRNLGIINNFLVTVDVVDQDGVIPNRVRWSPINDPSGDWTPSQSTQADFQNCEDGNPGAGMAVIGGQNYGVIVFRNAIYRMEYVGPPAIFTFTLMEQGRGAITAQAVTKSGSDVYYLADNGLWKFNGNFSMPIGQRKIDRYLAANLESSAIRNLRFAADPTLKAVLLAYTSIQATDERNDKMLCYNWADDRFTEIEASYDVIFSGNSPGWTLEEIGAAYPSLETVPYSLDSSFWAGGAPILYAVSGDVLGTINGKPMTGYLESQEVRLNSDGLAYLQSVLPVFDGGACSVRIGSRKGVNGEVVYTTYQTPSEDTGEVCFESEARYHRAGVELTGEWRYFQGIRFRAEPSGAI